MAACAEPEGPRGTIYDNLGATTSSPTNRISLPGDVMLVEFFCTIELGCGHYFGNNRPREPAVFSELLFRGVRRSFLLKRMEENHGTVLTAHI
jgi:hypothetical protein